MYHFVMRQARGRAGNIGCGVIHQGPWKAFSHRRRWHEGFAANGGICRVKRWATRVLMATNLDCEVASATVDYANVHLKQRWGVGKELAEISEHAGQHRRGLEDMRWGRCQLSRLRLLEPSIRPW